ncbi:PREDICTED: zinc finger matrin-type protein 1-like [Mesitornis unicolor]|uniref:zinc finger matrin-type protein 1-like n=1 Tax=Mesitornis unicolor TaxID=54374 RepID=UPI000528CF1B|nr:PREDICTED: zinc finger matrin-type protein 1-like [Mesitornis unicolor]
MAAAGRGRKRAPRAQLAAPPREDDALDEATRKDLFTDTFCKLCGAVLQSESQRTSHYEGKKHAQKLRVYIQMHGKKDERQKHSKRKRDCVYFQVDESGVLDQQNYCNLCNMILTSPVVALSHYLGKIHTKKLKQLSRGQAHVPAQSMQPVSALQKPSAEMSLLPSNAEETSSSNKRLKLNDSDKYCKLCCAPFNNPLAAQEHYTGKKHRRNEARKKILEELGDTAVPVEFRTCGFFFSAVGVGYYVCGVCNIALTSIETYKFHVQGNKHRNKETALNKLTKKSKKTHVSFQGEFMDCIQVQEARSLEQRSYLRKAEEFQDKNIGGGSDLCEVISSKFKCEQGQRSSLFSKTQLPANTGENRLPGWPSVSEHVLEKKPSCHYNKVCCKEEQASEVFTIRESFSLSVAESKNLYKPMLAETSTSSYREQKFQVKHFEVQKYLCEELKYETEAAKQKRKKKNSEGTDFRKENEKQKRIKLETDVINEKKSVPCKGKRLKENPAKKERKKNNKDKKPQTDGKIEEEILWDESILRYF